MPKGPKSIVIFTDEEQELIEAVISALVRTGRFNDEEMLLNNRTSLEDLARSISLYPSILEEHTLAGSSRTIESLIHALCTTWVPDMVLHIPTKAVLGRGFTIAKINFFNMLKYMAASAGPLEKYRGRILEIIAINVFILTAEEVYISIIEDMRIDEEVRHLAGYLTAHIWEHRLGFGVKEFAPILQALWKSREKLVPHFGTMMGFAELCVLSSETEPAWFDFLQRDELGEDEVFALNEFIFGLTHEEILSLRRIMEEKGRISLTRHEVDSLLEKPQRFPEYWSDDPRELYRSYRDRKHHSRFRARSASPGPKKTLEEYLMIFLLPRGERTLLSYIGE